MYVSATQTGDGVIEVHKVLSDWGEAGSAGKGIGAAAQPGDATWLHTSFDNSFWVNPGGDFAVDPSAAQHIGAADSYYTWGSSPQLVKDVQAWLDNPSSSFGWLLMADETQNSAKQFESRESTDPALRPSLTIGYSEALPSDVSISDITVIEGDAGTTAAQFDVTLSAPSSSTVTVDYSTADGLATAGSDYVATKGTITFAPNQTSQTLVVEVNGDQDVEPDETFFVNLQQRGWGTDHKWPRTGRYCERRSQLKSNSKHQ